jgi:hypothetical protein
VIVLQAGVLVTLGGCHLLDGLVARDSVEARKGDCAVLRRRICERFVLTSRGSRRATLLERVGEYLPCVCGVLRCLERLT